MASTDHQTERRRGKGPVDTARSPAYWQTHPEQWPAPVRPRDRFFARFSVVNTQGLPRSLTLEQALALELGGHHDLARQAVAGLLNSMHPDADYWLSPQRLVTAVSEAFEQGSVQPLLRNLVVANGGTVAW